MRPPFAVQTAYYVGVRRWQNRAAYFLCVVALATLASRAVADDVHVIETGREADVLALLSPYSLGSDVQGWTLDGVSIEATSIDIALVQAQRSAHLVLFHVEEGERGLPTSASFAFRRSGAAGADEALRSLIEAVTRNDDGAFWRVEASVGPAPTFSRSPVDGLLLSLFFLCVLVGVAFRVVTNCWLLALITFGGIALRAWISPRTMLGAWFYSRTTPIQRTIEESASLRWLNLQLGGEWAEIDIFLAIGFVFAAVTPLALFLHARLLLGDERRALFAAAVVAVLPIHLRFSASEVAFIPSIVFSSSLFACAHGVMKGSRRVAVFSALALIPMSIATLYARPLNMLFVVLLVVYVVGVDRTSDKRRRLVAGLLPTLCAIPITFVHLLAQYGQNVREGASLQVLASALALTVDPEKNTLINLSITPWPLLFMIVVGFVLFVRRPKGDRPALDERRYAFLLLWLGVFFVTHAYVVPASAAVQARYHLHLLVPVVFAAAMGLDHIARRSPKGAFAVSAIMLAAPLTHYEFVTDVNYNDLQELAFVREAQRTIPEGCEVLEYAATDMDARFRRGGLILADGRFSLPYTLVVQRPGEPSVVGAAPECRLVYEGLSCLSEKNRNEEIAPECAQLLRAGTMTPTQSVTFTSRIYDENLARGFSPHTERIQLTLYRAE